MSNRPSILALDLSAARTGIAEGRAGDAPRVYSMRWQRDGDGDDHCEVLERFGTWLIERLKVDRPDYFALEAAPPPGSFKNNAARLWTADLQWELIGVAKFVGGMKGLRPILCNVQAIRKVFVGHGRPQNPKACAQAMCRLLGWDAGNSDGADAAAVFHFVTTQKAPQLSAEITKMMYSQALSVGAQKSVKNAGGVFACSSPRT